MAPAPAYGAAVRTCSWLALVTGVVVIVGGWAFDVSALRSVVPGAVGMKALTATALIFAGTALLLLVEPPRSRRRLAAARAVAVLPGVIGLIVLAEYVGGWDPGIDEWPFVDHDGRAAGIAYPGRLAPTTAVCMVLFSAAAVTLDAAFLRRWRPAEILGLVIAVIASMSLIGYAYSIPAFYGPASAAKMAVNTAGCFLALAVGLLLARPRGRILELATTTDPGGVMIRRLTPLAVVVPLVLGWLHLKTVGSWDVFDFEVGTWWVSAVTIAGLALMIWSCAASLSRADEKRKVLEDQLYELATRDPLTGLANRHRFEEELSAFVEHGRRYGSTGALVIVDLDRLKVTNDLHGHPAGDELLRAVADAMAGRLRSTDFVARLGGDEFAVLLREVTPVEAERVAGALVQEIALVSRGEDGAIWSSASAGVACLDDPATADPAELVRRADAAMYRAKADGGDRAVLDAPVVPLAR